MSEETIFVLICKLRTYKFVYEVKEKEKEKNFSLQKRSERN